MEFGLHLPHIGPLATRDGVLGVARAADAAGIDSLWVSDHVVVAARLCIGLSLFPLREDVDSRRRPVSRGRIDVARSVRRDGASPPRRVRHRPAAAPTDSRRQAMGDARRAFRRANDLRRGRRMAQGRVRGARRTLQRPRRPLRRGTRGPPALLEKPTVTFRGKHFQIDRLACEPKPIQQPRPPIWIGGHTPAAFRRVARYADAWHGGGTIDVCRATMESVRAEAEKSAAIRVASS